MNLETETYKLFKKENTVPLYINTQSNQIDWLSICARAALCNIIVFGLQFQGKGKYMEHSFIAKISKLQVIV